MIDLLNTVEAGGCSAKLSAEMLEKLLKDFPVIKDDNLLVGTQTQDDAGVYKLNEETALIFTTDFFPPVCSEPYIFGQIAAANALSDVYAMGGKPLLALNIMMFPSDGVPAEVYPEILKGGNDKVNESGGIIIGGHTINDKIIKYGLAVVGIVHPKRFITNSAARAGDMIILTKPLGTGIAVSAKKLGLGMNDVYYDALEVMLQLNDKAATLMQKHDVKAATDITGFGLLGHAYKIARESKVSININSQSVPLIDGVYKLADEGCLPGAVFRNLNYVEKYSAYSENTDKNIKMIMCDAQTSGGMLIVVASHKAEILLNDLKNFYPESAIIGEIIPQVENLLIIE